MWACLTSTMSSARSGESEGHFFWYLCSLVSCQVFFLRAFNLPA